MLLQCLSPGHHSGMKPRCPMAQWGALQTRVLFPKGKALHFCAEKQGGNLGPRVRLQMTFKEGKDTHLELFLIQVFCNDPPAVT